METKKPELDGEIKYQTDEDCGKLQVSQFLGVRPTGFTDQHPLDRQCK